MKKKKKKKEDEQIDNVQASPQSILTTSRPTWENDWFSSRDSDHFPCIWKKVLSESTGYIKGGRRWGEKGGRVNKFKLLLILSAKRKKRDNNTRWDLQQLHFAALDASVYD